MQSYHQTTQYWPVPMRQGVLVEIDFAVFDSAIQLLNGNMRNLPTARVRVVSPFLDDEYQDTLLPEDKTPGSFGARVLISEGNLIYLRESEYEAAGLSFPSEENGLGDLGIISADKIIALVPHEDNPVDMSNTQLLFAPLGSRVFFEYDFDDESSEDVELESGIIVPEASLAMENQLATVTAIGPDAEHVAIGDRIVAPMQSGSVTFEGKTYPFVTNEHEIISVLREV